VAFGTAVEVHRGDSEAAADRLKRFAELQNSADVQEVSEYACGAATFHLAAGDAEEALRFAEIGIAGREALSFAHSVVKEAVVIGLEGALALDDTGKVAEILGMVRSDPLGRRSLYLQAHSSRCQARSTDGEDHDSEQLLKSSIGAFREIGFPFWIAVTLLEYGEWLDGKGRGPDAAPVVAEARSIFEELGARPWIDRAGRVTSGSAVRS
jgi:hypothetical protein